MSDEFKTAIKEARNKIDNSIIIISLIIVLFSIYFVNSLNHYIFKNYFIYGNSLLIFSLTFTVISHIFAEFVNKKAYINYLATGYHNIHKLYKCMQFINLISSVTFSIGIILSFIFVFKNTGNL